MSQTATQYEFHVDKRARPWGRWLPAGFYGAIVAIWIGAGIQAQTWELLWQALLAAPALALYLWRTRRLAP